MVLCKMETFGWSAFSGKMQEFDRGDLPDFFRSRTKYFDVEWQDIGRRAVISLDFCSPKLPSRSGPLHAGLNYNMDQAAMRDMATSSPIICYKHILCTLNEPLWPNQPVW